MSNDDDPDTWSYEYKMQCLARYYLSLGDDMVECLRRTHATKTRVLGAERADAAMKEIASYIRAERRKTSG